MKDLEGHLKGLNMVLNSGQAHGEEGMERTWRAKELKSTSIKNQRLQAKDQKPLDENGRPEKQDQCVQPLGAPMGRCQSI